MTWQQLIYMLPPGLCGAPPTFSRAVHHDTSRTEGFPVGTEVTYRCRDGFFKIPGKSDTVVCLSNSEWSTIGEFCSPSCGATPRLKSAALSKEDEKKNFHANRATVSYVCRPGYEETELRPVITCLENFTWSEAPEFCRGKSCGVPKGPEHGRAVDITNHLFGARVNIICDDGFRLRGRPFIQCMLKGDQIEWSQLPTCEALVIITQDKPTTVPPKGTEVAGTSSGSALNTAGNSTVPEGEGPGIAGIGVGISTGIVSVSGVIGVGIVDIITQDKPTTVPPKGTEVAGTSSVITTQDKPTTVPLKGTEVAGTSSDSTLNTIGHSTELEDIITQDKPTTVSPKGTEVAGTSSVITTQDKPTTVPLKGTEVAGTSSDSTLNTIGHSTELEGPGIDTHFGITGIGLGIGLGIASIASIVGGGIAAALIIQYQKKKSSYNVNPDSPKHQITTTQFQV